ncbi:SH3 domain-containing protein [Sporolactobacillus sp. KGMB 08714]|uniref:SH3 domain-containing protein n=1 Tax=Sporolactobacillus sp. KGMB 08714 TaxID=3064704 RepID=UPI002FBD4210
MNPNRGLTVIGTFAAAAAVTAAAGIVPSQVSAQESFQPYEGQATDDLNVRSLPGTDQPKIGLFYKGQTFNVIGIAGKSEDGNWLKIQYKNGVAYVDSAYVVQVSQPAAPSQAVQSVTAYQGTTTDSLNVRFLPSLTGTILTTLRSGTTVTVTGKTADGWLQIKYNNGSAYVSAAYVKNAGTSSASSTAKVLYTGTTTDDLNVRTGASTSSTRLATLSKGTKVEVVGTSGSWLQIVYKDGTAYVSADYVQKPGSSSSSSTAKVLYTGTTTDDLNVRTGASTSSTRLATLSKGTEVEVVGTSGSWLQIVYKGGTAYVSADYVQKAGSSGSSSTPKVLYTGTTTDDLNVRTGASTSSTRLATLSKGTKVEVVGTSGSWLQIVYKGGTAYVSGDYVQKAGSSGSSSTPKVLYTGTTTDDLNVRTGASTSSTRLATLSKGTKVEVVGTSGSWLQIVYKDGTAYVSADYVQKPGSSSSSSTAKVLYTGTTTDDLNVRTGASTSSTRLATLSKGTEVEVVGTSGSWLQIVYKGGTAYVSADYVQKAGSSGSSSTPKVLYTGTTTDALNVRTGASTGSTILATLSKGTEVEVVGTSGSWLQIIYKDGTAYVSGDYVQKQDGSSASTDPSAPGGTSQTTSSSTEGLITTDVNFRKGPDTTYGIYQVIPAGTTVEWLADAPNGWVKVSYGGNDGYVYGDYVKKETSTTTQSGNNAYKTTNYPISFSQALEEEQQVNQSSQLAYYLNPKNFAQGTPSYFQFLQLSSLANISLSDMNLILSGKGILSGYGSTFIDAAKKNGVNEVYLAAHAMLETGNGTSNLANGIVYKGVKVYNMFGIGAYDQDPENAGAAMAYSEGWTTPAKAIEGGAAWIAKYYIYNSVYQQDTLYKMRWNPSALVAGSAAHQYATDVAWAVSQTSMIDSMYRQIAQYSLVFDIPQYN